ncbi:preprotein translocase subunit YajC [Actinacidiphila acidipaludis]|uniref:Preprotein translocase subunit YajC n=1 Tax=Actinacidiphila acidipaludis TaxID=2873382 RepID=A0ABS7QBP3_9ACTN|nr:preprotein translocase subunit YajC [Streptomyces acidipaludis]MBY8879870.1 preprotein translocase subunit YajC [Streptomyces acidipaludis]
MNIGILLPLILIVGVMFMMSRSAKNRQRQASEMRSKMEPGTGVRTIGGLYAVVKEVNDETVLLELTDGVHAHFAKNAIATVLGEDEFNRIVHGIEPDEPEGLDHDAQAPAADAGDADAKEAGDAGTAEDAPAEDAPIDLSKSDAATPQDSGAPRDGK